MQNRSKTVKIVAAGLVAGFCNGLFGSGGGIIVVPSMTYLLAVKEHDAHATAIAVILPLSIVSAIIYLKSGYFHWDIIWKVASGGIIGGLIGAWILPRISAPQLRKIFAIFMIIAALRMLF